MDPNGKTGPRTAWTGPSRTRIATGPANVCPPNKNGSTRLAAETATGHLPHAAAPWPSSGTTTGLSRREWRRGPLDPSGYTIWRTTFGSGPRVPTAPTSVRIVATLGGSSEGVAGRLGTFSRCGSPIARPALRQHATQTSASGVRGAVKPQSSRHTRRESCIHSGHAPPCRRHDRRRVASRTGGVSADRWIDPRPTACRIGPGIRGRTHTQLPTGARAPVADCHRSGRCPLRRIRGGPLVAPSAAPRRPTPVVSRRRHFCILPGSCDQDANPAKSRGVHGRGDVGRLAHESKRNAA